MLSFLVVVLLEGRWGFPLVFAFTVEYHRMVLFISTTAHWFALINMLFRSRGGMMVSVSLSLPPAHSPWQPSELMEGEKAREKEKTTIYTETQNRNGGCLLDASRWWTQGTVSQSLPALKGLYLDYICWHLPHRFSLKGGRKGHAAKFDQNTGQFECDGMTLTDRKIHPLVVWEFGVKDSTDFRTVLSGATLDHLASSQP